MSIQTNFNLNVTQLDANGVNVVNRTFAAVGYAGVVGEERQGVLTGTGATVLTLPTATVFNFAMKNTHASANITITATKQGGTGAIVAVKGPGSIFVNGESASGTGNGYTAISLTSDTVGATYETYMGG